MHGSNEVPLVSRLRRQVTAVAKAPLRTVEDDIQGAPSHEKVAASQRKMLWGKKRCIASLQDCGVSGQAKVEVEVVTVV